MRYLDITPEQLQAKYYAETSSNYDESHLAADTDPEQKIALNLLLFVIDTYEIKSILDVGAGTGRTIQFVKNKRPHVSIVGIEPVDELREIGYHKGISNNILISGDGANIKFPDNTFDLVCEFAVLHHVPNPSKVIQEMSRVTNKIIFISDSNNIGQGGFFTRIIKLFIKLVGLKYIFEWLRTRGKMYHYSDGDGLFYSYSIFNDYPKIKRAFSNTLVINTSGDGFFPIFQSKHAVLIGVRKM